MQRSLERKRLAVADLSALTLEDLVALKSGDLSKMSLGGLNTLKFIQSSSLPSAASRIASDPITRGAEAAANASPADLAAGSAPGRFLLQPARGLLELGSHTIPGANRPFEVGNLRVPGAGEAVQESGKAIERGRAAYENKGMDIAGLAGQVASPAVLGAAKIVPAGAKMLPAIAGDVATGATAAATTPTAGKGDFWTEKGMQAGEGALGGAVVRPAQVLGKGLLKTIWNAIEPITPSGPAAILNRFQEKLLGPAKDKVIEALRNAKEIVPGSAPTAGEAVAEIPAATALAAHQKLVAKSRAASGLFATRTGEQEAARAAALEDVAEPTGTGLSIAEMGRTNEAKFNYARAFDESVKADPTLARLAQDPYFKKALPDAIDLAASKRVNAKDNLTQFLHFVKEGLDNQLSKTGDTAIKGETRKAVSDLKSRLLSWMDEKNPAYQIARERFASMSRPINQMQVGQGLAEKLAAPLGASERAAAYASALRDPASLIKETGAVAPLEKILTPEQLGAVRGVGLDLGRQARYERLARQTNLAGADMTPESVLPNLLYRPAMATNWVAKRLGHNLMDKVNEAAAKQYLNPAELAASLADKPISARQKIIDELLARTGRPAVIGLPVGAVAQQL